MSMIHSRISKLTMLALLLVLTGCHGKPPAPGAMPPLPVGVIKTVATPVTLHEEYAAQTEAVDTVEIRARVGGILERQAYVDGMNVKKGDLLFVIDQQPYIAALAAAKAAVAQAEANHLNSQQVLDRTRPLVEEQAVSQQDLDTAIAKERSDAAAVEAAQAQVKTAQLNLGYTTIRAPIDGVISKALIKRGGLVDASSTLLATLYSVDPIYVNFTIGEQQWLAIKKQLGSLKKGAAVPYQIKLADGSDYQYGGQLNFIGAAIDPQSGTLQMRLSVPNPEQELLAGQFMRVAVPLETRDMIRLPQQAVQELQGRRSVLVVDAQGIAQHRDIVTTSRIGNDWLVESGLQPGETVIVEGTGKVHPGMPVNPTPVSESAGAATTAPPGGAAMAPAESKTEKPVTKPPTPAVSAGAAEKSVAPSVPPSISPAAPSHPQSSESKKKPASPGP